MMMILEGLLLFVLVVIFFLSLNYIMIRLGLVPGGKKNKNNPLSMEARFNQALVVVRTKKRTTDSNGTRAKKNKFVRSSPYESERWAGKINDSLLPQDLLEEV